MKITETALSVERSETFPETSFRIRASAKAFQILSSGLYSKKITAILRELGTNAADAHVAAGKNDTPFIVTLPNSLSPTFKIRDYGTGLSPESIQTVYTTYFESNKTDSNDYTGCLGLGSKSPFSYTDNFTVVDYFNGVKHTYTCFISEVGFPSISLMCSEETDEPNGLEVRFAVRPGDFYEFKAEAESVYSWFATRPKIVGQTIEFPVREPLFSGNGWDVYAFGEVGNGVLMGNVFYRLDLQEISLDVRCFTQYNIIVNCPVGEVEMTASRESLEYTPRTCQNLKKYVEDCIAAFQVNMQQKLESQTNYWDACTFYLQHQLFFPNGVMWQGRVVDRVIQLAPLKLTYELFDDNWGKVRYRKPADLYKLSPANNLVIVDNDVERGARDRVKHWLQNLTSKVKAYVIKFPSDEVRASFLETVGLPEERIIKVSTLEKPPRTKPLKSGPSAKAYTFIARGSNKPSKYWSASEVTLNWSEPCVYVVLDRWTIDGFKPEEISYALVKLKTLGYNDLKVYGIRKQLLPKVKRNSSWRTLKEFLQEVCVVESNKYDLDLVANIDAYASLEYLTKVQNFLREDTLTQLVSKVNYVRKQSEQLRAVQWLCEVCGNKLQSKPITEYVNLSVKYPLLMYIIKNNSCGLPSEALQEYVRLVNNQ